MGRGRPKVVKVKVDSLSHLHAAANTLTEKGEIVANGILFKLEEIIHKNGMYECEISKDDNSKKIFYGHVKEAKSKLEAVLFALEHMTMMGYSGLSSKEDNCNDQTMIDPTKIKRKYKPRKNRIKGDTETEETEEEEINAIENDNREPPEETDPS